MTRRHPRATKSFIRSRACVGPRSGVVSCDHDGGSGSPELRGAGTWANVADPRLASELSLLLFREMADRGIGMEEVRGKTFFGKKVQLDDKIFVDCSFDDCVLLYSGEKCEWQTTNFTNCRVVLDGAANNTVQVLRELGITLVPPSPEASPESSDCFRG